MTLRNQPLDPLSPAARVQIEAWAFEQMGYDVEHFHHINTTPVGNGRARVDAWFKTPIVSNEFGREVVTGMSDYNIRYSWYVGHNDGVAECIRSPLQISDHTVRSGNGATPGNAFGCV